ncbi:MAG TPA: antibiotic biosynthesis monooxygenase [Acidimicrobiales bacterium]|nr:antibiotic biosynthesis monooxygenase [Acidimicrobiales bacterium]
MRFDLAPGHAEAFDRLAHETVAEVKTKEPGTIVYACHRVAGDDSARVFYELYRDQAAFDEHERQDHTRRFLSQREQHLAVAPRVEFLSPFVAKGVTELDGG